MLVLLPAPLEGRAHWAQTRVTVTEKEAGEFLSAVEHTRAPGVIPHTAWYPDSDALGASGRPEDQHLCAGRAGQQAPGNGRKGDDRGGTDSLERRQSQEEEGAVHVGLDEETEMRLF